MQRSGTQLLCAAACSILSLLQAVGLSQTSAKPGSPSQITVSGAQLWLDTNIDLRPGEKVQLTANGEISYPQQGNSKERKFGPDGLPRGFRDVLHQYPVADAAHGALIARVGPVDSGQPFLVGITKEFVAPVGGRLFLGVNQSQKDAADAQGSFQVTMVRDAGSTAKATAAGGPSETPLPSLTPEILANLPTRVTDPQGNPGDMVNVLIVGSEQELAQVFAEAGWVKVDTSVQRTIVSGLLNTLEKKDYLTMPMSPLYLFKRVQDYGFAHAEAVKVAMARNHLRAWKSPYEVDGRPLWCISATRDIGFERDQRNNGITHKIDPAIDGEREYVNTTLSSTGLVAQRTYVRPENALQEARTATGGSFHSDGRILVLVLKREESQN